MCGCVSVFVRYDINDVKHHILIKSESHSKNETHRQGPSFISSVVYFCHVLPLTDDQSDFK